MLAAHGRWMLTTRPLMIRLTFVVEGTWVGSAGKRPHSGWFSKARAKVTLVVEKNFEVWFGLV